MIITIDGATATGKSSVAKKLARAIGFIYFETGAMYRAFTYGLLKRKIDPKDFETVLSYLDQFDFRIKIVLGERHYYLDQEDVTDLIRSEAVTRAVSEVAAIPEVREKLVALQREMGNGVNAVFEGRDMGTIVFPDAHLKIYLTGRAEVRAKRRFEEMLIRFPEEAKKTSLEEMTKDINRRDERDSTREIAPLKQADDAYVVDTSDLTIDEVVFKILELKDMQKQQSS